MSRYFTIDLVPQLGGQLGEYTYKVTYHGTSTTVSLFEDSALSSPISNPSINTTRNISFYVADGTVEYDITVYDGNITGTVVIQNIWSLPGPIWADVSTIWSNEPAQWAFVNPYNVTVKKVANVGQLYIPLTIWCGQQCA